VFSFFISISYDLYLGVSSIIADHGLAVLRGSSRSGVTWTVDLVRLLEFSSDIYVQVTFEPSYPHIVSSLTRYIIPLAETDNQKQWKDIRSKYTEAVEE